jgi:hypothetical protein
VKKKKKKRKAGLGLAIGALANPPTRWPEHEAIFPISSKISQIIMAIANMASWSIPLDYFWENLPASAFH